MTDITPLKAPMLDLIREFPPAYRAFIDDLTETERAAVGTLEHWAAKDTLAHATFWVERVRQRIEADRLGKPQPGARDYDAHDYNAINADTFEARRNRPWEEVIAAINPAYESLIAEVETLSETDLTDPQRYPWQGGTALWRSVIGNAYSHPQAHFAEFYVARGDLARATQINETTADRLGSVGGDEGRGIALYNLVCFYALNRQQAKALPLLSKALALAPSLVAWSKEDQDLASLRSDPAYQALYTA